MPTPFRGVHAGDETVRFIDAASIASVADAVFESHRARIARVLSGAEIHHIGSTAIGGLTKGDVDLVVRVAARHVDAADTILARMYPRNTGSDRTDTFRSFEHEGDALPVGIQLCAIGGPEDTFLRIRDLLRDRADLRAEYDRLKREHDGASMHVYRAAKSSFIARILETPNA